MSAENPGNFADQRIRFISLMAVSGGRENKTDLAAHILLTVSGDRENKTDLAARILVTVSGDRENKTDLAARILVTVLYLMKGKSKRQGCRCTYISDCTLSDERKKTRLPLHVY